MKLPISVIILTYNEEANLKKCLENIRSWVGEIFIVDSYSNDKTLEIAEEYQTIISQREFKGYSDQLNWALDNLDIKNEWILRLDSDEEILPELWKEIAGTLAETSKEITGFYLKRRVYFMGRWIKHGGYYPTWILRLFRRGKARSEEREMDEHLILIEGKAKKLKNDFIDNNKKDLEWWISKHNRYSSYEVEAINKKYDKQLLKAGIMSGPPARKRWLKEKLYMKLPPFFRAFIYYFYRYIIRLGFFDGKEGLIFHFLQGFWYRFLVDAKLYEAHGKSFRKS